MNIPGVAGHFWHEGAVKPGINRPFFRAAASVIRCAADELRADDRICRSIASMGLAALVKLRNRMDTCKGIAVVSVVVFTDAHPLEGECDLSVSSSFTHLSPC